MAITAVELRRLRQFSIVEVEWEDAHDGSDAVTTVDDAVAVIPYIRYTVGYLVRADKEYVVVCGTDDREAARARLDRGKHIADTYITPTPMVRAVRVLDKPTRR